MRLYVAGPMSPGSFGLAGTPAGWDYNYPAFETAAARLREAGYDVESPAEPGQRASFTHGDYLRRGLMQLVTCDAVATLDGWEWSTGAKLEVQVATLVGAVLLPVDAWLAAAAIGGASAGVDQGGSSFARQAQRVVDTEWLKAVAPE